MPGSIADLPKVLGKFNILHISALSCQSLSLLHPLIMNSIQMEIGPRFSDASIVPHQLKKLRQEFTIKKDKLLLYISDFQFLKYL